MESKIFDTDLVFADLQDAKRSLDHAQGSPRDVRRAFSHFVELTQKLTSVMRTDFSRHKSAKWNAGTFTGWTIDTAFLKWLRNEDQHAAPIYISVHQRNYYRLESYGEQLFVFEGTWVLVDQMAGEVPASENISLHLPDPVTGEMSDIVASPVRIEYLYLFQPRTEEAKQWFQKIGNSDIHQLAKRAMPVLDCYHKYFHAQFSD